MNQRTDLRRTFCLHCGEIFADIWGLKAHQEARTVARTMRRSSAVGGILAGLLLPLAGWLAAPSAAPASTTPVASMLSLVPAGVAEAPELLVAPTPTPRIEIVDALMIEAPDSNAEVESRESLDNPGVQADDPGPNTDPNITAQNTVDPNGGGISFAPEGTPDCYDTVSEYLDEWHRTGVQPQAPCFVVPS